MKTVKYQKTDETNCYDEIYQSSGVEFSIVKREKGVNRQISPFFKCRDFLSDAFWSVKSGYPVSIYNFSYPPSENFISGRLRFLVRFPTSGKLPIEASTKLLKKIEADIGIPATRVFSTTTEGVYLVSAAKYWAQNPAMISFVTFIFRQGVNIVKSNLSSDPNKFFTKETHETLRSRGCTDQHTTCHFQGYDKIKELLSNQDKLSNKFHDFLNRLNPKISNDVHKVHYRTGISSVLSGSFDKVYREVCR